MASFVRQWDVELLDEPAENVNYRSRLHCLSSWEEMLWFEVTVPYGQTEYDGALFWD